MKEALDYSAPYHPGLAAKIKAAGYTEVIRYLGPDHPPYQSKIIRKAEVDELHAAGIGILLNWEQDGNGIKYGYSMGKAQAAQAQPMADALGYPRSLPIAFSEADFDVQPSDIPTGLNYVNGLLSVRKSVCSYGGFRWIEAVPRGVVRWQTFAWSYGMVAKNLALFQRKGQAVIDGVTCDVNEVYDDTIFWRGADDMTPEEHTWLSHVNGFVMNHGDALVAHAGAVTVDAIAEAVVAKLPPGQGGADASIIAAAVAAELRKHPLAPAP